MAITLKELADHLGLSTAAVSKALCGKSDISAQTRERVQAAAKKLGYSPNYSAKKLRQGHTSMVALMLPSMTENAFHTSPFFMQLNYGLETVLMSQGYHSTLLQGLDDKDQLEKIKWLCEGHVVDAIILMDTLVKDPRINYLKKCKFPFVCMGRTGKLQNVSFVDMDHAQMVADAVAYALSLGKKRIAALPIEEESAYSEVFVAGYKAALAAHGLEYVPEYVVHASHDLHSGFTAMQQLMALPEPPDFVVCLNDLQLASALSYFHRLGQKPIEMVCCIISSASFGFFNPASHYFALDLVHMGKLLGKAVLHELQDRGKKGYTAMQEIVPVEFKKYDLLPLQGVQGVATAAAAAAVAVHSGT
ncbi:MAG: LacI family transcriptional regulator [Candidatus Anaerobiospirillum pullicola]|uniref:LacI family transcriptional regulator n=1 Tax=Candidatus Anaerobiospirillum pullicola TaxID=2838451 RepID=A0A948TGZ9_9GAMM|nr:LacI family transcriptional regulator [Candidatus Anaerobiospirillum pullicola]